MSFELLLTTAHRLQTSVEALAALGAELRIRREGLPADPQIVQRLQEIISALDPTLLADDDLELHVVAADLRRAHGGLLSCVS